MLWKLHHIWIYCPKDLSYNHFTGSVSSCWSVGSFIAIFRITWCYMLFYQKTCFFLTRNIHSNHSSGIIPGQFHSTPNLCLVIIAWVTLLLLICIHYHIRLCFDNFLSLSLIRFWGNRLHPGGNLFTLGFPFGNFVEY